MCISRSNWHLGKPIECFLRLESWWKLLSYVKNKTKLTFGGDSSVESIYLAWPVRSYFSRQDFRFLLKDISILQAPLASPQANSHLSRLHNLPVKYRIKNGVLNEVGMERRGCLQVMLTEMQRQLDSQRNLIPLSATFVRCQISF